MPERARWAIPLDPGVRMGGDAILVCVVLVLALVLFVWERWPIDQVAVSVPVVLLAAGVLNPHEAISGFANPATVTVAAMLVLSLGLVQTGAVRGVAHWAQTARLGPPWMRLAALCVIVSAVSPFLNNTPVVLVFLPVFLGVARKFGEPPSRYLLPLSYSAILGGTVTLIGTSTNLIVYGLAYEQGLRDLGMFSISKLGLIYLGAGLIYVFTLGRWLLPRRAVSVDLSHKYDVRRFLSEMRVSEESGIVGRALRELRWGEERGVTVVGIARDGEILWSPGGRQLLRANDVLLLRGHGGDLVELSREAKLLPETTAGDVDPLLDDQDERMVEIMVAPDSPLAGHTLSELRFQQRNWATVLGIQRQGETLDSRLASVTLQPGDLLLVHGPTAMLDLLADEEGIVPLGEVRGPKRKSPRSLVAGTILAAVILAAATDLLDILPAALIGVVLMLFTGCVRLSEVYERIDWMVIFLLAGLIPLGIAMEKTGVVHLLVQGMTTTVEGWGAPGTVAFLYLITSLLTSIMSNNAAAIVLTPVAIGLAQENGLNPYAMLVAVMFGASASFMTPMSYQTNTLVYGPGGYRFADYLKVGMPLNLLLLLLATWLIPRFWPS